MRRRALAGGAALIFIAAGCGGGDDAAETTTTTSQPVTTQPAVATTLAATTTTVPVTTQPAIVTEGAIVAVANASRVDGGAGRLSERLGIAGFEMGTPANSSEGPLEVSRVYYNASVDGAQQVAESVRVTLGAGPIELLELPTPAPVESGDIGDATVLVAMGNDIADKTLADLQGEVTTTVAEASDDSTTTTAGG